MILTNIMLREKRDNYPRPKISSTPTDINSSIHQVLAKARRSPSTDLRDSGVPPPPGPSILIPAFTLWPHGEATLDDFLNHLNSLRHTIKFTMKVES
jgi:hypothetical protein